MYRAPFFAAALLSAALIAAPSYAGSAGKPPVKAEAGMLVGSNGMTLYTFDNDPAGAGKSACNGPCAENWPPLKASDKDKAEGEYSIITRDDGTKQWAYKGKPLYFWAKDQKAGDTTGDGVKGVWHVAKP